MAPRRLERINELIRDEISDLIRREIRDPRLSGLVSITDVETSPDIRYARVYVSVLGPEEERKAAMQALKNASGFLRKELGGRLNLRRTPQLSFSLDVSLERGARIMELIRQIERESERKPADEDRRGRSAEENAPDNASR